MALSKTLIPLLSSPVAIAIFLIVATANTARSQTTSFTYDFYGEQPDTLTYQGDAHFPSDTTYLRLTKTDDNGNALPNSAGRIIYADPFPFWDTGKVTDFETTIKFIIKPNPNDKYPADGLAFFIAPVGTNVTSSGGNFGIFGPNGNQSSVFAVEFDIFVNGEWDPSYRHVGIDIESRKSVATANVSDDLVGKEVTMRVNYVGATKMISAVVTSGSETVEVIYEYDLEAVLPQQVQAGIAASTGANMAIHDVISWYMTSTIYLQRGRGKSIRQIMWN